MTSTSISAYVAEFSLRLVIPFCYKDSIEAVEQHLSKPTIKDLLIEDSPFTHLIRTSDDGSEKYLKPIKQEIEDPAKNGEELSDKEREKLDKKRNNLKGFKSAKIWEKTTPYISKDLYPHIRRILENESNSVPKNLQMTQPAWEMLNGGYGNFGSGLALTLTNSAKKRLGTNEDYMPISFCQNDTPPSIHLMDFGLGVLVIEVSIGTKFLKQYGLSAAEEIVHELSRTQVKNANLTWLVKETENYRITPLPDKTYFKTLISTCLGIQNKDLESDAEDLVNNESMISLTDDNRFFSFSALRLAGAREDSMSNTHNNDLLNLAFSLAQRHTAHYKATEEQIVEHTFKPYENIVYGMSTEGGSVVIDTTYTNKEEGKEAIQHNVAFIRDVLKKAYWPMLLMTYIEFRYLIELSTHINPKYKLKSDDDQTLNELEKQREKILNFRLHYRYSQASQITNHNTFFKKWRVVFDNDKLSDELSDDISQINSFLNYQADRHDQIVKEKQDKIFSYFGIFATTFLSVVGLFGTNFVEFNNDQLTIFSWFTLKVLLLGLVAAAILVFGYKFIRDNYRS